MSGGDHQDKLPDGVTEESVEALMRKVAEALQPLGLYSDPLMHVEIKGDRLVLVGDFEIGDLALAKRVQDPQQSGYDDSFREIERHGVQEEAQGILDEFRRDD